MPKSYRWTSLVVLCLVMAWTIGVSADERPLLTIAMPSATAEYMEPAIERFTAIYQVDVEVLPTGGGDRVGTVEWIVTRHLGDVGVDIVAVAPQTTGALQQFGVAADLQPFFERDASINMDDFLPIGLRTHAGFQGQLFALPYEISPRAFMANLDMVQQAGLASPNDLHPDDWNWDRLEEYGRRLTRSSDGGQIQVAGISWGEALASYVALQSGGFFFDHPSAPTQSGVLLPETVAGLERWASWFQIPIASRSGSVQGQNAALAIQTVSNVARIIEAGGGTDYDWDVIRYPMGPANNAHEVSIWGFTLVSSSRNIDLAWELMKHLATERQAAQDQVVIRARPPVFIPNLDLYLDIENFPPGSPPGVLLFHEMLTNPHLASRPGFPGYEEFDAEYTRLFRHEGITGVRAVRSILEELSQLAERLLADLHNR